MNDRNRQLPYPLIFAAVAALVIAGFPGTVIGQIMATTTVHTLCDSGSTFHRLSRDGDVSYRCTRIIDYPPTQGATQ